MKGLTQHKYVIFLTSFLFYNDKIEFSHCLGMWSTQAYRISQWGTLHFPHFGFLAPCLFSFSFHNAIKVLQLSFLSAVHPKYYYQEHNQISVPLIL
jgi:hypothetical protein